MNIEKGLLGIAAVLSIAVSIVALQSAQRRANLAARNAARNSFFNQTADQSIYWNPNDQSNPNGMSAYGRNPMLDNQLLWSGTLAPGQTIPGAGIGGPTGAYNHA